MGREKRRRRRRSAPPPPQRRSLSASVRGNFTEDSGRVGAARSPGRSTTVSSPLLTRLGSPGIIWGHILGLISVGCAGAQSLTCPHFELGADWLINLKVSDRKRVRKCLVPGSSRLRTGPRHKQTVLQGGPEAETTERLKYFS